ncbi:MAG TPA: hypothetical protein ENN80_13370 [Candidatus Hydrogenedentes bacterium]|nr:hypothetical protein [Candidatus Hydrogenedentota bacterium]
MASNRAAEFVAGWLFWTILCVLLAGPCIYGVWRITEDDSYVLLRVGVGIVAAAIVAGMIAWAVNSVVQWRYRKRRLEERKKAKKRKRG